jgi:hypothetical protein
MRKSLAVVACALLGVAGLLAVLTLPADARRGGGGARAHVHAGGVARGRHAAVNRGVSRNVNRNVVVNRNINRTVNRRYVQRNGRWGYWRNGVWVAAPLAAAGAGYVATCAYEYNRWKSTGSAYWRDRYYKCAG